MRLFWLLFFLIFVVESSSQSSYADYKELLADSNKRTIYIKIDSLINFEIQRDSIYSAITIIHDLSLRTFRKRNYSNSLKYAFWEKELYEKNKILNRKYINVLYNIAYFYYSNFEYNKALFYYNLTLEKDTFNYLVGDSYFQLGRVYDKIGNYNKSISYYMRNVNYLTESKNYGALISTYINLSAVHRKLNTEQAAHRTVKFLSNAEELSKIHQISLTSYANLQNALGNLFITQTYYDFDKAKQYRMNNLRLGIKYNDSIIIAQANNNLSHLYNIEKLDSAYYFIQEGLKFVNFREAKARLNDNLADYQIIRGNLDGALESIHNSLEIITKSEIKDVPSDFQISESLLLDYTLYCLKKKSEIYLRMYERDLKIIHIKNALKNIERAEYMVSLLLNATVEESTQMIWRREASQAYLYGAYAAHLLGDTEQAFSFMEKNKALLLSEGVLKNTEFANLPKHISDEETRRKKQIYRLEDLLSKQENNALLQDSLFMAKRSHERYVDSLKVDYPKYFARKINVEQITLSEVQSELKRNDALVSFIWSDFDRYQELMIGLVSTKDSSLTFKIEKTKELKEKLEIYKNLISKPFETKSDQQRFQNIAYELYNILFPTEEIRDLLRGKNLMIIPDGDLQNIPFEALITKENTNEYLIYDSNINYAYSYSFLKHNEKVDRKTKSSFIGYSPVEFSSLSLSNLGHTKKELKEINSELDGVIKLRDTATKEDFLQNTSESKIIHLATHADAGANPWIAFADDKLELHELYTYKNNADLVTLSACNTSLGNIAKGEGVLSLARGFFYSGSKSVVSSLWNVNDQSTSDVMTNFYKNLKKGQTKSEAINNAKRKYLSTHSLSEQSPYYWSSFILIGDAGAIEISSNLYFYYIGIAVIFLSILFFRKKIKIFG